MILVRLFIFFLLIIVIVLIKYSEEFQFYEAKSHSYSYFHSMLQNKKQPVLGMEPIDGRAHRKYPLLH